MLDRIRIILLGTSHPGNAGGAARAMKTMGLSDLVFVNPRCEPVEGEAIARSSGAEDILHQSRTLDNLDDAIGDCTLVVGCSARSRTLPWPMISPRELSTRLPREIMRDEGEPQGRVAILFGREDSGLTNDELQRCHLHVHIQANPEYSSLNLAAAIQVISYECRQGMLAAETSADSDSEYFGVAWDRPPAAQEDVERLFVHLEQSMIRSGFHDPAMPRQLMARMRRMLMRTRLDDMEVNILRGMLSSFDKFTPPR
ncbi:RNA methyltransferase [Larsenimonas rhizosphaerae]|uniref:tRNA (cytidine/uridine-2'-O-)-methyltransferase TrmJ n=1 Tax=Larsenimonas rhizosphaerae TaxID=2944682 RepID=A0AA41ZFX4_9GAMM|nr:RNA methyltransferase [Larsenimonas rhizosphaerae]MCX2524567.1 RNA methyltransferase [Larsenimonas rhizosphaerae]